MKTKMNVEANVDALSRKVMNTVKNKLYFENKALGPAIYRFEHPVYEPSVFGTDGKNLYLDPYKILFMYKEVPDDVAHLYIHTLCHCIFLHPFLNKHDDIETWNFVYDFCAESAVARLYPKMVSKRQQDFLNMVNSNLKLAVPEAVYKFIKEKNININDYIEDFYQDDHLWMMEGDGGGQGNQNEQGGPDNNGNGNNGSNNDDESQDDSDGNGNNGNGGQDQNKNQDGNGGGNNNQRQDKNQNQNQNNNSRSSQSNKQKWENIAKQISVDMQSFHKGDNAGNLTDEIDYMTRDRMDYSEFLRKFATIEEVMKIDMDEFDMNFYSYGLQMPGEKKKLLIEPLEYKDELRVKEFVIAIDTSGSCSGELVRKFLNKTFSILKSTESFGSRVNVHIVQCDARMQDDKKITNLQELDEYMKNFKIHGMGGTDFRPVFEYVDTLIKNKEFTNLEGLIYFTDGYGTYPTVPTQYKTAFVFLEDYSYSDKNVPAWAMKTFWKLEEE